MIEVLVATTLFLLLGAVFSHGLSSAWTLRRNSTVRARAVELAVELMERLHAGAASTPPQSIGTYTRSSTSAALTGVMRHRVVVEWTLPTPGQFTLTSLQRLP